MSGAAGVISMRMGPRSAPVNCAAITDGTGSTGAGVATARQGGQRWNRPGPLGERPGRRLRQAGRRLRWAGGVGPAQAGRDEFADVLYRVIEGQAAAPGQFLRGRSAIDRAGQRPLCAAQHGSGTAEVAQPHWCAAAQAVAGYVLAPPDRLGHDRVNVLAGEGRGPVCACRREPHIRDVSTFMGKSRHRDDGVHDHGSQDGCQFRHGEAILLHQGSADITIWLVSAGEQIRRFGGAPERAEQPGADGHTIANP